MVCLYSGNRNNPVHCRTSPAQSHKDKSFRPMRRGTNLVRFVKTCALGKSFWKFKASGEWAAQSAYKREGRIKICANKKAVQIFFGGANKKVVRKNFSGQAVQSISRRNSASMRPPSPCFPITASTRAFLMPSLPVGTLQRM